MTADKKLARALADAHDRKIAVYQDRDGVTLDLGMSDRNLTITQARELIDALRYAWDLAWAWHADHMDEDGSDGR